MKINKSDGRRDNESCPANGISINKVGRQTGRWAPVLFRRVFVSVPSAAGEKQMNGEMKKKKIAFLI